MSDKISHKSKRYLIYIIAVVVILFGAWLAYILISNNGVEAKAVYKGETLTATTEDVNMILQQAAAQGVNISRQDVARQLVTKEVLLAQARSIGITFTDAQIQELADTQYAQLVAAFGEENLTKQLQTEGMTKDEFMVKLKETLRDDVTLQGLINQEVFGKVSVSEEQLQQMYVQYQQSFLVPESASVKHILICYAGALGCVQNRTKAEALALITQLKDAKAAFGDVARQYSDDSGSAVNGGDLGVIYKGQTVPEFENAAFSAQVGTVVGPVESPYGYHLITTYAKAAAGMLSYAQVRDQLRNQLISDQANQLQQAYVAGLMSTVEIKYN
ncbi:MAG TPA: peptidylprolyl isomerase [Acidobacteriota bacterium]|nr:peptidylprolyl isomerase [Acidobacteriota bacterium]